MQYTHEKNDFISKLLGRRIKVEELKQELIELIQSTDNMSVLNKIRSFLIAINECLAQRA